MAQLKDTTVTGNLDISGALAAGSLANSLMTTIVNTIYPVGSYFWSSSTGGGSNSCPITVGTWTRVKDRFVLAAGDSYTSIGGTGGSSTVTLTTAQLPLHAHSMGNGTTIANGSASSFRAVSSNDSPSRDYPNNQDWTGNTGGGEAHENMPPYIVAYCWRRTA